MYPIASKQANRYTQKFIYALQVPDAKTHLMDKFSQAVAKGSFVQFLFFVCVCFCLSRLFLPSVRYSADIKMGGKAGPNSSVCSQQNARKSDLPTLSLLVRDKIWSLENKV